MQGIIQTFFLAMTPIGELRAALPVALTVYKLNWLLAYVISVIGNLVPAVLLLLFLESVSLFLSRHSRVFKNFFDWLSQKTKNRGGAKVKKYGYLALALFVAVPLPTTGAWTGALLAFLFKMPFIRALAAISGGVALAGAIVVVATKTGIAIEKYLGWQTLLVILACFVFIWVICRGKRSVAK